VDSNQSANISSAYSDEDSQDNELQKARQLSLKKKTRFMTLVDDSVVLNEKIDAEEGLSKNTILIIPLVDKNEISLVYHNRDNMKGNESHLHPEVQRSAFVDYRENILVVIRNQYLLYSRTGVFRNMLRFSREGREPQAFEYTKLKLLQISDLDTERNLKKTYFLFIHFETNML